LSRAGRFRLKVSGDFDVIDRAAGLANLAAGQTPVGEDANAIPGDSLVRRVRERQLFGYCSVSVFRFEKKR
jgi:hypothetical protein